ncbi:GntR family transcriptional regulator [Arthrobacter woluwensis]|uniref:DNA-binding transcriptional regulator, GntR family n=1 Tax=Arthrobacter woluwensis TaxID=156980 RepID=A0A1H4NQU4_9MICC|nr:GntR family transcriptional regulator [Arthrobacter woluwensis]SEB97633.1 DNA-binding transcriptional regulator, GntR family [Arthrobacter woluwensis]
MTADPGVAGRSLADQAYETIKDRLVMLDIRPGEPLNDGLLAAELGMGRTPVREAIKRLETDHLLVSYPRRGTFATSVDITELAAIWDIRSVLEPVAARRAAENATPAVRQEMKHVIERLLAVDESADAQSELMRLDMSVHRLIYRAAGNPHLEDVLIRYDNLSTRIWCLVIERLPGLSGHIVEHAALLQAIVDGDADRAAELALAHVTDFETEIRKVL